MWAGETMSKKVLIVEDEDLIAKVLSMRLENSGYKALIACDGEEGLALAKKEKPWTKRRSNHSSHTKSVDM